MIYLAKRENRQERRRFHPRLTLVGVVRATAVALLMSALIVGFVASAHAQDGASRIEKDVCR